MQNNNFEEKNAQTIFCSIFQKDQEGILKK